MQVPTVKTFVDAPDPASILTYADWNAALFEPLSLILNPPMVHVRQTSPQSIPNSAWTALNFNTEVIDTESTHSTSGNTSRITPKTAGWYVGWFGGSWLGNASGIRALAPRKNGNLAVSAGSYGRIDWRPVSTFGMAVKGLRFWMPFNGTTDYVELVTFQSSGGALNTFTTAEEVYPELYLRWWRTL